MSKYAKYIGGALGWALGGPIGAIMGYAFGSMVGDNTLSVEGGPRQQGPQGGPRRRQTSAGDFAASMIVLSAAVMKADGRILKSELDYVKRFFVSNFGDAQAERYILTLREVLKQQVDGRAVCRQIQGMMEHSKRLLLLQYLYGIAQADGDPTVTEFAVVEVVAAGLLTGDDPTRHRDSGVVQRFRRQQHSLHNSRHPPCQLDIVQDKPGVPRLGLAGDLKTWNTCNLY